MTDTPNGSLKQRSSLRLTDLFICMMSLFLLLFLLSYALHVGSASQEGAFFARGNDFFADYFNVMEKSKGFDPYLYAQGITDCERAYLPLTYCLFRILLFFIADADSYVLWWNANTLLLLQAFLVVASTVAIYIIQLYRFHIDNNSKKNIAVCVLLLFSGVMLFSIERANTVILSCVCTAGYIAWYDSESKTKRRFAYLMLGIAAALKVYPALLGLLSLRRGKIRETAELVLIGLSVVFVPFLFIKGGFANIPQLIQNVVLSSKTYAIASGERFGWHIFWPQMSDSFRSSSLFAVWRFIPYLGTAASVILSFIEKVRWKRVTLLMLSILILPANSSRYNALCLFVCLALFLKEETLSVKNVFILVLFVLIFQPFRFVSLPSAELPLSSFLASVSASLMWIALIADCSISAFSRIRGRRALLQ